MASHTIVVHDRLNIGVVFDVSQLKIGFDGCWLRAFIYDGLGAPLANQCALFIVGEAGSTPYPKGSDNKERKDRRL